MIYLDNAATTRTATEVVREMLPYFTENYGNPSGVYSAGRESKAAVTKARDRIAALLGAKSGEVFFTSGGSESDNWAIVSAYEAQAEKGRHIITSKIEHHAVLRTCEYLERERGARVTYLDVDADGRVRPEDVEKVICPDTVLVTIMAANNEIGTIQPVKEIGEIAHRHGVIFHTDAVQAFGQLPFTVDEWKVDMLSASGHKFNGPKGTGFLYIRKGTPVRAFVHGGAQEHNRRAGTENVPGIVGIGAAAKLAMDSLADKIRKETELRDYLIGEIEAKIPNVRLNGSREGRLPNNVNFSFEFVEGESLLIMLDMKGICVSGGSACSSGSLAPSHVLKAIGLSDSLARGALRMTLSAETTKEEIDTTVAALTELVKKLRNMSPKYEGYLRGIEKSETAE
uniref:cysteine desulfurase NifS n=1 Tax=Eubacterium cellulosolvens TaxID=29322 RepID=UPI000485543B|nr:cysteine desulfurase NifS [[Eubacterium] cellulosolvens]